MLAGAPAAVLASALAFAVPAQARLDAGTAVQASAARRLTMPALPCPAKVPVQTITVVDQTNVRPSALAQVENAIVAQSLQLRAAWGTPCVQFGPGGWPVYLQHGSTEWGVHYGPAPHAFVYTDGLPYGMWSQVFSHEILEMLEDPTTGTAYHYDGTGSALEVADPVEERAYRLDGVWVSDFVLPAYFAGAQYLPCATEVTFPNGVLTEAVVCTGGEIAPPNAAGPYDEMGLLTGPWQTTWEQEDNAAGGTT
ncbi:MAG TPA: hypothetical protein VMA77_00015 [Solirubrobacteraceae bacterium]|nr:hypothetical protein [Solirubrobacteraceae bacterium]